MPRRAYLIGYGVLIAILVLLGHPATRDIGIDEGIHNN